MKGLRFAFPLLTSLLFCGMASAEDEPAASEDSCSYPTELLWHNEQDPGSFRLGVSVLNQDQQQMPGLKAANFKVFVDEQEVDRDSKSFRVQQSKNVFSEAEAAGDGSEAKTGVDPVHYDLYIAVDLTESMAETIEIKGQSKPRTKINFVANRIHELFAKEKLFDANDRVYLSGFTSRLEAGFMGETTADRKALADGLRGLLRFTPQGSDAALYQSMAFNLKTIRDGAEFYSGKDERRQAVLIVITDSFNGMQISGKRRISRCRDNDGLSETIRDQVRATTEATQGNFKLYMLAIGSPEETRHYLHEGKLSSRCNIRSTQQEVVDKRSFKTITSELHKGKGGFVGHPDPLRLLSVVQNQFESLRRAYEISYTAPEGVTRPNKFKVAVTIGEETCSDEVTEASGFIRQAKAQGKTKPQEIAFLLASLIFAFFFIPRSFANLSTVFSGSGESKPSPPKGKKKKKKRRRK